MIYRRISGRCTKKYAGPCVSRLEEIGPLGLPALEGTGHGHGAEGFLGPPRIGCLEDPVVADRTVEIAVPMLKGHMDHGDVLLPVGLVGADLVGFHQGMLEIVEPDFPDGTFGRLRNPDGFDQVGLRRRDIRDHGTSTGGSQDSHNPDRASHGRSYNWENSSRVKK